MVPTLRPTGAGELGASLSHFVDRCFDGTALGATIGFSTEPTDSTGIGSTSCGGLQHGFEGLAQGVAGLRRQSLHQVTDGFPPSV